MAKVVVKKQTKKLKRKFPVEFVAPEVFNSKSLGQSNVSDLNSTVGKTIKMNMMYVVENVKFQNARLTFKVLEVDSGKAKTQVSKYEQIPYYLSRFVKKSSDLVELNVETKTKDNMDVLAKLFIVTRENASGLVLTEIRAKAKELVIKEAESSNYEDFLSNVAFGKIQNNLRNELKKITPIKVFEFRKLELLN